MPKKIIIIYKTQQNNKKKNNIYIYIYIYTLTVYSKKYYIVNVLLTDVFLFYFYLIIHLFNLQNSLV